jgi:hypothetical protein
LLLRPDVNYNDKFDAGIDTPLSNTLIILQVISRPRAVNQTTYGRDVTDANGVFAVVGSVLPPNTSVAIYKDSVRNPPLGVVQTGKGGSLEANIPVDAPQMVCVLWSFTSVVQSDPFICAFANQSTTGAILATTMSQSTATADAMLTTTLSPMPTTTSAATTTASTTLSITTATSQTSSTTQSATTTKVPSCACISTEQRGKYLNLYCCVAPARGTNYNSLQEAVDAAALYNCSSPDVCFGVTKSLSGKYTLREGKTPLGLQDSPSGESSWFFDNLGGTCTCF